MSTADSAQPEEVGQEELKERFLAIMEECIPHRYLRKRRNLPWLTKNIIQLIRKCNVLFRKAKRSMKDVYILQYKKLRNRIVDLMRNSKKRVFLQTGNC